MSDRHDLLAYLATLATLVIVFVSAMAFAAYHPEIIGKLEAFGLGTITGGLIGVLRIPSARPIATTQEGDVNVTPPSGGAFTGDRDAPPTKLGDL